MTTSDYNFTEITENSQLEEPNMEKAEVFFNLRAGHDLPKKKPQVPQPNGQPMFASTPMGLYARRNMINIDGSYRAKKWVNNSSNWLGFDNLAYECCDFTNISSEITIRK